MLKKLKIYWDLFVSTFTLSAFTFGGGYVIVPLMRKKFVDTLGWIKEVEMVDLVAIGQSAPGPIAINTSILVGYKIKGFLGGLVTLFGTVLPPLIVMSIVSFVYDLVITNTYVAGIMLGMNIGVAAVIMSAVVKMVKEVIQKQEMLFVCVLIASFVLSYFYGVNMIILLLGSGCVGLAYTMFMLGKEEKGGQMLWSI